MVIIVYVGFFIIFMFLYSIFQILASWTFPICSFINIVIAAAIIQTTSRKSYF